MKTLDEAFEALSQPDQDEAKIAQALALIARHIVTDIGRIAAALDKIAARIPGGIPGVTR